MKLNSRVTDDCRYALSIYIALASLGSTSIVNAQPCYNDDGEGPDACVDFDEGEPDLNTDFSLNFSDDEKPTIELRTASTSWREIGRASCRERV